MKIGIFDSGMGGLTVLAEAKRMMSSCDFIYFGDSKHAPYGIKSPKEVVERSIEICDYLIAQGVSAIVIACNTATSAAVDILREKYDIPIIGMEPAIKPALEENHGKGIVVMATPMTLREKKYRKLLETLKTSQRVYEIPAPKIVELVESGDADSPKMIDVIRTYYSEIPMNNIESIVLGCTHFMFIKHVLRKLYPSVTLIDGNVGTIQQLMRKTDGLKKDGSGQITIFNTAGETLIEQSKALLKSYEEQYGN